VQLPPLRDRREDIPTLAAVLLERHGARRDPSAPLGFTPDALSALVKYAWPGNVRELENAIERAIAVTDGPRIELEALPPEVSSMQRPRIMRGTETHLSYREVVDLARDRASREYLIALMQELGGNVTEAARRAGMERESLHRLLKRYEVRSEDFKPRPV
jgi:DNA-binding NtrC family response regulator